MFDVLDLTVLAIVTMLTVQVNTGLEVNSGNLLELIFQFCACSLLRVYVMKFKES